MKNETEDDLLLRRYLLGDLSQKESLQVEERFFLENDFFQTLQVAEDDLIDDYVYEDLSTEDQEKFDRYYLTTPERVEALRIAGALKKYISTNALQTSTAKRIEVGPVSSSKIWFLPLLGVRNPLLSLGLTVALLCVVIGGLWLIMRAVQLRGNNSTPAEAQQPVSQPQHGPSVPLPEQNAQSSPQPHEGQEIDAQGQKQEQRDRDQERKGQLAQLKKPQDKFPAPAQTMRKTIGRVSSLLLVPGGIVRGGGEVNTLELSPDARLTNLQVPLISDDKYRSYRAELQTAENKKIKDWNNLRPRDMDYGKIILVSVPVDLLTQTNYQLKVSGDSPNGEVKSIRTYYFRVKRK